MAYCSACQHFIASPYPTQQGECHRYPPTALLQGAKTFRFWPLVGSSEWCGEYTGATITYWSPTTVAGGTGLVFQAVGANLTNPNILWSSAMFMDRNQSSTPATITNSTSTGFTATCPGSMTSATSPWRLIVYDTNYTFMIVLGPLFTVT